MKSYYRVMLGKKSAYAKECFEGNYIGADFDIAEDLTNKLPEAWRDFNAKYIPVVLTADPGKSKIAAGLACGMLWTLAKGLQNEDVVLCPDAPGRYRVGEISGPYYYAEGSRLPHRRPVRWLTSVVDRADMSQGLKNCTGSIGTVCNIRRADLIEELAKLIGGTAAPALVATDATIEDPSSFAMESHLEDFLVQNWAQTELGKTYDIYEEDGESVGQQYETDTGPLDILAVSKNKKELLVVELKKGRASDVVVGQTLRYMGYVQEELAEADQEVKGIIIALDDDPRIRRALTMTPSIAFYRYQVSFKLLKS
jgi:restriction system protein